TTGAHDDEAGSLRSKRSRHTRRHQNGYANVAWLITRWMKRKGACSQKESMICCGQFITKIVKRKNLLFEEVLNSLSALIYCGALDTTLINSKGRLIPEAPEPGVPRAAIPRPSRASMQDLYERMESRHSYHWVSMTSIISSTHLSSNNNSQMMMSSVEMTQEKKKGVWRDNRSEDSRNS
nr:hypothetical protein [Tanacetum cinerariifolium]